MTLICLYALLFHVPLLNSAEKKEKVKYTNFFFYELKTGNDGVGDAVVVRLCICARVCLCV